MASKKTPRSRTTAAAEGGGRTSSSVDEMLLAALERGEESFETGRFLATFKEGAADAGGQALASVQGMRVADARDFKDQAVIMENVAGADAVTFPEIGVALIGGEAARERGMSAAAEVASDSAIASIDPEYFVFADGVDDYLRAFGVDTGASNAAEYLRGFVRAAETIARDLGGAAGPAPAPPDDEEQAAALGATWGLLACRVPQSPRSGAGIRVAVLDTGMDLGHPDFAGRAITGATFVGQPVQDLHSHGTHCIGTACGPQSPAGTTPRYGVGYRTAIFVGKVLSNTGGGVGGSVLAGMNWAVANRCQVISMSLRSPVGPQPYYTAAGQAALNNGLLIIAAAGNDAAQTGAPANSPTIVSVAALNPNLTPAAFSNFGKIDIAGPGVNVFSSVPRPVRYGIKSGTSMACPHVAGVAALWAESSPTLRGLALRARLQQRARRLPFPPLRVGAGLVQAP
ncbi:MAG: S8 family serine peptidase [Thermoanaerobaculia bacterium]